jgi:hypothetical protein
MWTPTQNPDLSDLACRDLDEGLARLAVAGVLQGLAVNGRGVS